MKKTLIILVLGFLMGCSTANNDSPNTQAVSKMAEEALKLCGKGNVKSVSTEGYICKNSDS